MAKKLVKKAASAASKKSSAKPASKLVARSASKPSPKSKPAPRQAAKRPVAPVVKAKAVNGKPAAPAKAGPAAKTSSPAKPAAARLEKAGKPLNNGVKASPERLPASKPAAHAPAPKLAVKPVEPKAEEPKPTGRPMLLQGPIAIKPMGKRATLPPPPPKPVEKPVKKKLLPTGEPAFVVVQPPTKAVATSEKAAKNKAGLSQKDLDYFRDLLLAKRRELLGDMNSMEREALRENSTDLSSLPVHMADQGTDAYEQEFTLHLVEKDRNLLRELNDALAKIQNGTYGICEGTGLAISKARLEAQPWARHGIEYARQLEKRQMMFRR